MLPLLAFVMPEHYCYLTLDALFRFVPTAVLSRQTAGLRGKSLIINLPGKPKAIRETFDEVPQVLLLFILNLFHACCDYTALNMASQSGPHLLNKHSDV